MSPDFLIILHETNVLGTSVSQRMMAVKAFSMVDEVGVINLKLKRVLVDYANTVLSVDYLTFIIV